MKILVIPDVHLKAYMFEQASAWMEQEQAEGAVCLMDIADDWNKEYQLQLYEDTYNAAIRFAAEWPDTKWCYGNHDLSYLWNELESGYSFMAANLVRRKLKELEAVLPNENKIAFMHRIDNVLFCHGGLCNEFVENFVAREKWDDVDTVIDTINAFGQNRMWNDWSPIWFRPQFGQHEMYKEDILLQVVGHTPVEKIVRKNNVISCDNFSYYSNGRQMGKNEFLLIDTKTWEYRKLPADIPFTGEL